jgi:dolichol kinase
MTEHEIPYSAELWRKALHLVALVIPLGTVLLGRSTALAILVPVTAVVIAADVVRVRSAGFAGWLHGTFGFMMRPEERPTIGSRPVMNGATWVFLTATLLIILFPLQIALAAFSSFMIADAAAAVVGKRFGTHRWRGTTRTVEGSLAFTITGILVMLPFPEISVWPAVAAVVPGAAAEIPSGPLNDNFRVPFVMAGVLALIHHLNAG